MLLINISCFKNVFDIPIYFYIMYQILERSIRCLFQLLANEESVLIELWLAAIYFH